MFTSEKLGFLDLTSNLNLRNYETNKQANFFINDLNWKSNSWLNKFGFESYINALVKTVNYETKKTTEYKNSKLNSELNSVFGYNAKLNLFKKTRLFYCKFSILNSIFIKMFKACCCCATAEHICHCILLYVFKIKEIIMIKSLTFDISIKFILRREILYITDL